ncbi:hypothetical protein KSP40_PGU012603 [Platanthera guangdongensis]|uniref:Uncharacterized protein n=1 Tax=Platanthera guangdongensis TaxID=2320717 RepID=A0ABR2MD66_9ASPA
MDISVKKLGARNQHDVEVFEWFKMHVIESELDTSIGHHNLVSYIYFIFEELLFI